MICSREKDERRNRDLPADQRKCLCCCCRHGGGSRVQGQGNTVQDGLILMGFASTSGFEFTAVVLGWSMKARECTTNR
jgi:hypothetical protein